MSYTIEQGIPLTPEIKGGAGRKSIYPFADLKVDESFLVPLTEGTDIETLYSRVRAASWSHASRKKVKLVARVVEGGIRVWRTA